MSNAKPLELTEALDLSIRSRRAPLSAAEVRVLEQALAASALVKTAHEVGMSFDATGFVRPGDDALIARAAQGALSALPTRRRSLRSRWTLALAATLVVATATATTGVIAARRARGLELDRHLASVTATRPPATVPRDLGRAKAPHPDAAALAPAVPSSPLVPSSPAVDGVRPLEPFAAALRSARPEKTAETLFHDASAARRDGDVARATALYTELQSRFPATREARVSQVSLGKLLLGAGHAREAEAAFTAYLRGGVGDLTEEALVGRASALGALGRSADERRAWADLVKRYGTSVYRARAEARLEALDAAAHASDRQP